MRRLLFTVVFSLVFPLSAHAAEALIAVASNFTAPMKKLAPMFERETGHKLTLAFGSTGKFYAQIHHGAPFDVLLAADEAIPAKLEQEGMGSRRYTYALGRLVLWSAQADLVDNQGAVLQQTPLGRLAIADPRLAPYGAAAIQTLERLGRLTAWRPQFVVGENISQAFQFASTGNAPLGFVAMAQIYVDGRLQSGSAWIVPQSLYQPIRQDAILLGKAEHNDAATAFMKFLRSEAAVAVLRDYGYTFE
ncbi:molybdate ABC transporter substrate-binding protein [Bordetella sp. 02P26C-1]|uniref:molybdate ABC transporter substrate-binding protein n=1 Tax=Bordetella sp. 02P26C-1 TaxID=2683195 RepID=UPI001353312A|nr:molybdate ABC transporter substrate-binding protein [Bordetella sp. 02P26C-1]MVW77717.1 molybdate ABC transporter substrate-binding protein [Bordetella sp. 02P26C-1]